MTITKINGSCIGHGQISNDPRDYYAGTCTPSDFDRREVAAEIETGTGTKIIVCLFGMDLGIKVQTGNGTTICSHKLFVNTVSPDALVAEAERTIKAVSNAMHPAKTRVAQARINEGLSQQALAKLTGISYVTLSRYETGETDIRKASFDTVDRIASALQCSIYDIV